MGKNWLHFISSAAFLNISAFINRENSCQTIQYRVQFLSVDKSATCPPINTILPYTQMSRDKKKPKNKGCSCTVELLIEPFHMICTKSTRGYRQQIKLGGMEKTEKTFYQEVNDVMQQYT